LNTQISTCINAFKNLITISDEDWQIFLNKRKKALNKYRRNLKKPLSNWSCDQRITKEQKSWIEKWLKKLKFNVQAINYYFKEVRPNQAPDIRDAHQYDARIKYNSKNSITKIAIVQDKPIDEVMIIHELGHLFQGDGLDIYIFKELFESHNKTVKDISQSNEWKNFHYLTESIADRKIATMYKYAAAQLVFQTIKNFYASKNPYCSANRISWFQQAVHALDLWYFIYQTDSKNELTSDEHSKENFSEKYNNETKKSYNEFKEIYEKADDSDWIVKRIRLNQEK